MRTNAPALSGRRPPSRERARRASRPAKRASPRTRDLPQRKLSRARRLRRSSRRNRCQASSEIATPPSATATVVRTPPRDGRRQGSPTRPRRRPRSHRLQACRVGIHGFRRRHPPRGRGTSQQHALVPCFPVALAPSPPFASSCPFDPLFGRRAAGADPAAENGFERFRQPSRPHWPPLRRYASRPRVLFAEICSATPTSPSISIVR